MHYKQSGRFSFTVREFVGSLGDLGTLLPLLVGLIVFNGIDFRTALAVLGATYILTGVYYRLPVPVQPLKAAAIIAIATGASAGQLRAAALWMAGIMLVLSVTRVADKLSGIVPRVLIHGLQFSLGILMIRSGLHFVSSFPHDLGAVIHGAHSAQLHVATMGFLPSRADFITALGLLVLPQLPLTIGNAVVATRDCAARYFGEAGERVTASRLAATIGLGNLAAGLVGGMPMCHGAGGMTAHYHFGARTGAACIMIGAFLLTLAIGASHGAAALLSTPAWVLGVPLAYAGVRHCLLSRESFQKAASSAAVLSMGTVAWFQGNLLLALGAGLAVQFLLQDGLARLRRKAIA